MYRELPVPPELAGVVEAAWLREVPPGSPEPYRVTPDGCTDLIWLDGALLVAGPDTRAHPGTAPLQAAVRDRLARAGPPDPVVAAQRSGAGVAALAAALGLSQRQLHRRCLASFGYGPKVLARVLRFRRAVQLARTGRPYAEVAAVTGYADQAHLAREVRTLSGVPLGVLTDRPAAG